MKIDLGITAYPGETFDDFDKFINDNLNYLEYRVNSIEDAWECKDSVKGLVIHAPDPQEDNWIDIISEISQLKYVRYVNVHARPSDEYMLCDCGARIMIIKNLDVTCFHCARSLKKEHNNDFIHLINKLDKASKVLNKTNKKLLIENTYEPPILMYKIMKALPGCGFTFDIGHSLLYSYSPIDYIRILKNQIQHLHLHDNMGGFSENFHDKHNPCGTGVAPWNSIINALKDIDFNGTATFECDIGFAPNWFYEFKNNLIN